MKLDSQLKNKTISTHKKSLILGVIIITLLLVIVYIYFKGPQAYAYKYINLYNKHNWEQTYLLYDSDILQGKYHKEEVIEFLRQQVELENILKVRMKNPSKVFTRLLSESGNKVVIPIEYITNEGIIESSLTLIKNEKDRKWSIEFPYELKSIYVTAPIGADIYIGNKKVIKTSDGKEIEIKDILPGNHTITIDYNNPIYPKYEQKIYVPYETKVESPYITSDVKVFAPLKTWVGLGKVKQYNSSGFVTFNNVLEGEYILTVSMYDKELEAYTQEVNIGKDINNIYINQVKVNADLNGSLNKFFKKFNEEYQKGILNKDSNFLHNYIVDTNRESIVSDFKMWYIDNKDIKDVSTHMQIRDIYIVSGKELKASVLEIVYLTNKEKDNQGNYSDNQYRVAIEWRYNLLETKSNWQIINREIIQSIVAYKDKDGNWIQY